VIGVSSAYLRKLLRDRRWDEEKLRSLLCSRVQRVHGKQLRGVIFEQTFKKSGHATPGMDAHGSEDKGRSLRSLSLTNLVLADRDFCCILDSDPHPPPGWLRDDRRRLSEDIPWHERVHSKWKGALDLVDRARRDGIRFDWLLLGRSYGVEIALLQSLSEVRQRFIAEVPESLRGWLYHPMVATANQVHPEGLQSTESPGLPSRPPRSIKELTQGLPVLPKGAGDGTSVNDGAQPWKARILSFYAESNGLPTDPLGLLVLSDPSSGNTRHFVSNGFLGVSLRSLTDIALSKDKIEGTCRQVADRVGLADFQLRDFDAVRRHLALSTLSMLFRAELTDASTANQVSPKGTA
jgi:hypothetical protein